MTEPERDPELPVADGTAEPADAVEPTDPIEDAEVADDDGALEEPSPEPVVAAEAAPPVTRRNRAAARPAARTATPSEVAVHVDDRISAAFVVLVTAVFAGLLLYGILGGHGGVLTPAKTATPAASISPSPSSPASESPSDSASPAASESASPSPVASGSDAASPSPSPSASPS